MMVDDTFFREIKENCWSPAKREEECDQLGVQYQVLSTVPVMFGYWAKHDDCHDLSRLLNDHIAEIVKDRPRRFGGLATLPMQAPDLAIKELERCMSELNMCGVQIGSHVNDWNLDAEELFPVFARAEELGAAIMVHPWDMLAKDRMKKYWLPWLVGMPTETALALSSMIFGGVLERLPKLKLLFVHGGGSFPWTIGRIEHGFNARPDLCAVDNDKSPRSYIGKFYVDTAVYDPFALRGLIDLIGPERIALGSDYPFPLGEAEPGKLVDSLSDIGDEVKHQMLVKTPLEFLGLKEKDVFGESN